MAYGHFTDITVESFYSRGVLIFGIRLLVPLSDPNKMESWDTDIDNAYLKTNTFYKVYIIAVVGFGD